MVIADPDQIQAPGTCTLCERGLVPPVEFLVDTEVDFDPGMQTAKTGRQYVCSTCVDTLARVGGFVHQTEVENDLAAADDRAREADELVARIDAGLSEIEAAVETIRKEADSGEGPSDGSAEA